MTPKFRYCLGTYNKPTINDEIEISEKDYLYCSNILERFQKLSSAENLFRVVELNYADLEAKLNSYLPKSPQLDFYEFDYSFVDLNRLILNLLSSIRTYLDHTELDLKENMELAQKNGCFLNKKQAMPMTITSSTGFSISLETILSIVDYQLVLQK